jgi:hypothetical protein
MGKGIKQVPFQATISLSAKKTIIPMNSLLKQSKLTAIIWMYNEYNCPTGDKKTGLGNFPKCRQVVYNGKL